MGEIDPIEVVREAFSLIARMHLRLPTRFALLDKTLATLGSVGAELYPEFNVFEVAEPYADELMAQQLSPSALLDRGREELMSYGGLLMELPYQVHDTLEQFRDGEVEVQFRHRGLDQLTVQGRRRRQPAGDRDRDGRDDGGLRAARHRRRRRPARLGLCTS